MEQVAHVCEKCMKLYTSRPELIRQRCFHPMDHKNESIVRVKWSSKFRRLKAVPTDAQPSAASTNRAVGAAATAAQVPPTPPARGGVRTQPRVRPVPEVWFKGAFRLCKFGQQCLKGDRCTFAHNKDELREWNRQKLGTDQASPLPSPQSPVSSQASPHSSSPQSPLKPSKPPNQPFPLHPRPIQPAFRGPQHNVWAPSSLSLTKQKKQMHASEPLLSSSLQPPVETTPKGTEAELSPSNSARHVKIWNRELEECVIPCGMASSPTNITHFWSRQRQSKPKRQSLSLPDEHSPHFDRPLTVEIPPRHTTFPHISSQPPAIQPPQQRNQRASSPPRDYAARKFNFHERLEEPLIIDDVIQELSSSNYKEKFHKLLCWEEKGCIDILQSRCDGEYLLVLHQAGLKRPDWLKSHNTKPERKRFGYIQGLTGDQIAYATQASEAVYISQRGVEVKLNILSENYNNIEERLYVAVEAANVQALQKCLNVVQAKCERSVSARFELKHSYFNLLHQSLEYLSETVIEKIFPKKSNFTVFKTRELSSKFKRRLELDKEEIPDDKIRALKVIASCPASGPPVLISGAFGTGKTRLLALAAHYFLQESQVSNSSVRILVATPQQVSADAFLLCFARELLIQPQQDVKITRLATKFGKRHPNLVQWYKTMSNFRKEFKRSSHYCESKFLVVCSCALSVVMAQFIPKDFFTHILLDNGAQSREPESIAPLSLANENTKIVIAGDVHQVGASMLVLGREAREHGLAVSLLQRLQRLYQDAGPVAKSYTSVLSTNYRCHRAILNLAEDLFYEMPIHSQVPDDSTHPTAPYPLAFVCSSIDDTLRFVQKSANEQEAWITLQQVVDYLKSWPPHLGGPKNVGEEVCVISSHRNQITQFSRLARHMPHKIKNVQRCPTYDIQGREYTAVFISTSEPTEQDGSTRNPTKSICDRFVFNTTITRARSLVVAVGNPFLLLKIEEHMVKKYGEKGRCWSKFLKVCLEKGSLTIDRSVRASQREKESCFEKLERLTKADKKPALQPLGIESPNQIKEQVKPIPLIPSIMPSALHPLPESHTNFIDPVEVINCDSSGGIYHNPVHGITLRIPEEAIPHGKHLKISIGVGLCGNFSFPNGLSPVSAVVWLCTNTEVTFSKCVEVIVPHFLDCENKEDAERLEMQFMKASHRSTSSAAEAAQFLPEDGEANFISVPNKGILYTHHFCYLCICAKVSPEQLKKRKFYIACAIRQPLTAGSIVYFYILYFLETCIQCVKEQLPEGYFIVEKKSRVFKFSDEATIIGDFHVQCSQAQKPVILTLESPNISQDMIDFWQLHKNEDLKLLEKMRLYPPSMQLTFGDLSSCEEQVVTVLFKGTQEPLEQMKVEFIVPERGDSQGASSNTQTSVQSRVPSLKDKIHLCQLLRLKTVPEEAPIRIIETLAVKWKDLGITIDFDSIGRHVQLIEQKCIKEGPVACCREVLQDWLRGEGVYQPPTWENLLEILRDMDDDNLATTLHRLLADSESSI